MIRFACPLCHKPLQVDDNAAGKRVKCPQCGGALAVPAGNRAPTAGLPMAAPLAKSAPQASAVATPGTAARKGPSNLPPPGWLDSGVGPLTPIVRRKRQSLLLPLSIGSVVLVGTAVALTLWVTGRSSPPSTDSSGPRADDVRHATGASSNSSIGPIAKAAAQVTPPVSVASTPASSAAPASGWAAGMTASQPSTAAPQAPSAPTAALASVPAAAGRVEIVDVIRQINPVRDSARGSWTFQGTALASPHNEVGVLRLPVTPPAEYRLTVVVQRFMPLQTLRTITVQPVPSQSRYPARTRPPTYRNRTPFSPIGPQPSPEMPQPYQETPQPAPESDEGLDIVLLVDGHPAALVLDGWQRTVSGLELIDGKGVDQNGTVFHGEVLTRLRAVTVICTVAPGSVDATVDGRTIVHWTGQSDRLSLDPGLAADVGNGLALVSSSQFRIQRIELVPLGGTAPAVAAPAVVASTGTAPAASATPATPSPAPRAAPSGPVVVGVPATTPAVLPARARLAAIVPSPEALQCVALVEHPLGSGSGFAVGKRLVVTNAHVVEGVFADEIKVRFGGENGKPQPAARILYFDRSRDLAVIELPYEMAGLTVRGDYTFTSGDRVTLVGNPSAGGGIVMRNAVNHGRFSGLVHIKEQDFYQIEASVNPGWSGGPVLDADGKVVAIVAMKAADKVVAELRGSMGQLDQDFRARIGRTAYNVGLTYGIPAVDLWAVLKDPEFQNEDRQAEANDRCAARTLTDRLSFLAELCTLRVQINVPAKVRSDAASLALGRPLPGGHRRPAQTDVMTFLSQFDAMRLGRVLDSETIKSIESKFQDRLDERITAVQESASLPDAVKRDLRTLASKIREANKFAEHPPTTYMAFSVKVKGFSHDFKEYLKRLAENLKEKES